jgi:hypothetical protein
MTPPDPIIFREIAVIRRIIADETWLESERRGHAVSSEDPVVREQVCRVVLRIGQEMREAFERRYTTNLVEQEGHEAIADARCESVAA